jgi:hypothetical protein
MGHPLDRLGRIRSVEHQTLQAAWSLSEVGWQLYLVYAVDDEGMCACSKGPACPDPGKHPTTPHGFNDASSDPERIAELSARWPGGNVGLKTGSGSGTIIIDVDVEGSLDQLAIYLLDFIGHADCQALLINLPDCSLDRCALRGSEVQVVPSLLEPTELAIAICRTE